MLQQEGHGFLIKGSLGFCAENTSLAFCYNSKKKFHLFSDKARKRKNEFRDENDSSCENDPFRAGGEN